MVTAVTLVVGPLRGASFRYPLIARAQSLADRNGVALLAFGFAAETVRFAVDGPDEAVSAWLKALKVGTSMAALPHGVDLAGRRADRRLLGLVDAVAWAHAGPLEDGAGDALASPWSSHRDLLCLREAAFFRPTALRARVDARALHARLGGDALPDGWPPPDYRVEDLHLLLRVAGAVLGRLPADRRCFRLFVHLAKARGFRSQRVAAALALTTRRVRQLLAQPEPLADLGLLCLGDGRLRVVP
jgi:hypothetical protein